MPHGMLVVSFILILLSQNTLGYKVAPWRSASTPPQSVGQQLKGRMQLRDQSGDSCLKTLSPVFSKVLGIAPPAGCLLLIDAPAWQ